MGNKLDEIQRQELNKLQNRERLRPLAEASLIRQASQAQREKDKINEYLKQNGTDASNINPEDLEGLIPNKNSKIENTLLTGEDLKRSQLPLKDQLNIENAKPSSIQDQLKNLILARQGGKGIIETSKPVFGQTGQNVKFRTPSVPQEAPVDYAAMNNPDKKESSDRVQEFIEKLKKENKEKISPVRKPASEGELEVVQNPAEAEFTQKRSGESLNRAIEHMQNLPNDPEARSQAWEDIMNEGQLSPEDQDKFADWAEQDYKLRMK